MKTLLAAALALTATAAGAETWTPDATHTEVLIGWNHAGFSTQTAKFHTVEGSLDFTPGEIAAASADFSVMVDSLDTGVAALDGHLKGGDFFAAEDFPAIRFVTTSVEQTGEMSVLAKGDMTVKDVTKPVEFAITVHNLGAHPVGQFFDAYKGEWLGMTATATINRSDFGMSGFIPIGSDQIDITINTEMRAAD